MATSKTPAGLGVRGGKFWIDTTDSYDLSEQERTILLEVCRTIDNLDQLDQVLRKEGPMSTGAAGHSVVHPALTEVRGQRLALHRLIAALGLPDDEGDAVPSARSLRAKRAAEVRWAGHLKVADRGA